MEDMSALIHCINTVIVLLVCVNIGLFLVYYACRNQRDRANTELANSKTERKVTNSGRYEELHPSNGHITDVINLPETANTAQALVEVTQRESTPSSDKDEYGNLDEDGNDLDVVTKVNHGADVSCGESSDSTEESDYTIAESIAKPRTSTKKKEKKPGKHKSSHHNKHHLLQYHAQPVIDPSRIAELSEKQNYLRTVQGKCKQQERKLNSFRHRITDLQNKLREYRAEGEHLVREKTYITQRIGTMKGIERGLDREITDLREMCEQTRSKGEEKDALFRTLHSRINEIAQDIESYDKSLIAIYEDSAEQLYAIAKAAKVVFGWCALFAVRAYCVSGGGTAGGRDAANFLCVCAPCKKGDEVEQEPLLTSFHVALSEQISSA
ncbi:hypothetical protein TcWFU_001701 [Taenia crassiceps]|uniref:Uncharacterized protein n=1 Tax=Taenia crassiceps TaxID=6207 RepID=A0ABR4Q933_9CEST